MAESSAIEWTDHTWSPWLGCTPLSPACDHCFAAALARRFASTGWPQYRAGEPRRRTGLQGWRRVESWQRRARANGVRSKVFPSLCDPFDAEVPIDWCFDFVAGIDATPDLDWLVLTKRPKVAAERLQAWRAAAKRPMPRNLHLGVTAENQAMAELRVPQLLAIPDLTTRFVSIEPMLGDVDLTTLCTGHYFIDALRGMKYHDAPEDGPPGATEACAKIDWVICGGESGPNSRPSHPYWIRRVMGQCLAAGVAFFFKQWGDWAPGTADRDFGAPMIDVPDAPGLPPDPTTTYRMTRVGKKNAGAMLDGREWRQLPPQLKAAA